jgi:hypothetical protein
VNGKKKEEGELDMEILRRLGGVPQRWQAWSGLSRGNSEQIGASCITFVQMRVQFYARPALTYVSLELHVSTAAGHGEVVHDFVWAGLRIVIFASCQP